jgi:hypothetical protein
LELTFDRLLNFVLVKERIAFQAYSTLIQNVPLSTRGSIISGEWLKQAQRHNLAKRLVHQQWGMNDFAVSSRKTLRIISQGAWNVNGEALPDLARLG